MVFLIFLKLAFQTKTSKAQGDASPEEVQHAEHGVIVEENA